MSKPIDKKPILHAKKMRLSGAFFGNIQADADLKIDRKIGRK
jgi:hypothetical protein